MGAPATYAILAGGKAERQGGVDKGLLEVEGRACLDRLLDSRSLFAEALVVGTDAQPYTSRGLRPVHDLIAGKGAPGGVYTALVHAQCPWVFAVACDMPFVTPAVVERLLLERGPAVDAICFEVQGRLEPLLAVYRTGAAPSWARALEGEPSFRDLFGWLRTRILSEEELRRVDPVARAVVSLNTPEDVARWSARARGGPAVPT